MKRYLLLGILASLWLALPTDASAHVGHSSSMAVDDRARIMQIQPAAPPFQVRVVDGDQDLWLQLDPGNELVVLGGIGEPFLRFNDAGVFANTHSSTAQTDLLSLIPSETPSLNPRKAPSWFKLTTADRYLWHDHRIHALALLSDGGPARRLGEWNIPLKLNGGRGAITGDLRSIPLPNRWFWLVLSVLIAIAAVAVLRWKGSRFAATGGPALAVITVVAVLIAHAGRDLYGRPEISTGRYITLGLSLVLGAIAVERLFRGGNGTKFIVAMVVGVIGLVQGLTMLSTFWHGLVLVAIPMTLERACVALAIGAGVASLVFSFTGTRPDPEEAAVDESKLSGGTG
jgi:hypothetical protein